MARDGAPSAVGARDPVNPRGRPFSAVATPFVVTRRNRRWYFANCAWDAVAFHAMLNEEVRIGTQCHHLRGTDRDHPRQWTGDVHARKPIRPPLPSRLAMVDDIVNTRSNHMVLFRSRTHLDDWRESNPGPEGAVLTVEQTHALSVPIIETS